MRERPPAEFFDRFRALMAEAEGRGVSVTAIAVATGIHRSRLYRWRAGHDGPSGNNLAAIADYFGVSMDFLWGRSDDPTPPARRIDPRSDSRAAAARP